MKLIATSPAISETLYTGTMARASAAAAPDGSAQGMALQGTAGNDVLKGGPLDDTINGGAGDDMLIGDGGNDRLDGGDGRDDLDGGAGDDLLYGGPGYDRLEGRAGNDRLEGGDGDDFLVDGEGDNVLIGGAGNDSLDSGSRGANRLEGGDGNDVIHAVGGNATIEGGAGRDSIFVKNYGVADLAAGTITVDGGDGDDRIVFDLLGEVKTTVLARGGQGIDTFLFQYAPSGGSATVLDFQVGEGGDLISPPILGWQDGVPSNPFGAGGFLRFEQRGADAVLQVDMDGAAGPGGFKDMVTLKGGDARSVTAANIDGGFDPGGTSRGRTLVGTGANDTITGGYADDEISGGAGNDVLSGSWGNDHIDGGAGDDVLSGGEGNDVLLGGAGNDRIDAGKGDDTADGGDGDDQLVSVADGNKTYLGGAGNDTLTVEGVGTSRLLGGEGDDKLTIGGGGFGTLDGGAGNDLLMTSYASWYQSKGQVIMLGGAGDDTFRPFASADIVIATGGTGRDTFELSGGGVYTVTDFEAGAGGDRIRLGYTDSKVDPRNPFGEAGYLRLVQLGNDTVLEYDSDGAAGTGESFKPVLRLEGVNAARLVRDNFVEWVDPRPDGIAGTNGADVLRGGARDEKLDGGEGNDVLIGGAGNDFLVGGAGTDTARYSGPMSGYVVSAIPDGWHIADRSGSEGDDTLTGVERVVFADRALAFDTDGVAGQAYRIYRAAFDRAPDLSGIGFWIERMDQGVTVEQVAAGFVTSDEFVKLYGSSPSNTEIVDRLYRNVLHRAPEQAGFDFWVDILNNRKASLAAVLAAFSEGAENKAAVAELIGHAIAFQPYGG